MERDIYGDITAIMLRLGLRPKLVGFNYLREAVALVCERQGVGDNMTSDIYPKVAEKFDVSDLLVERCIRVSIADAFKTGGLLAINELYDNLVYNNTFTWSNSELISIISEIVKLKDLRDNLLKN